MLLNMLKLRKYVIVIISSNQGLICCFSNRGDFFSIGHFKGVEIGFRNIIPLSIPSPLWQTKTAYGNVFMFKYSFYDLL